MTLPLCVVQLLKHDQAMEALCKVDEIIISDRKRQRSGRRKGDAKTLLRTNLLSFTSHMTDMVQEIKFKAPIDQKKCLLRSFGYVARLLGQDIGSVAPQVRESMRLIVAQDISLTFS